MISAMFPLSRFLLPIMLVVVGVSGMTLRAEISAPPAPRQFVTDEAGVIPAPVIARLNSTLSRFEKQTGNQIVAMVVSSLPGGTTLADYAQILYHDWRIGSKKDSNGVLILVVTGDRKVRIQTGYGLEGALPDVACSRIIRETMEPTFRSGNYGEGLSAGIAAVMQATKGEYKRDNKGTGHQGTRTPFKDFLFSPLGLFLIVFVVLLLAGRNGRGNGCGQGPDGGMGPGSAAAAGLIIGGLGAMAARGEGNRDEGDSGDGFSGGGGDSGGGGADGGW